MGYLIVLGLCAGLCLIRFDILVFHVFVSWISVCMMGCFEVRYLIVRKQNCTYRNCRKPNRTHLAWHSPQARVLLRAHRTRALLRVNHMILTSHRCPPHMALALARALAHASHGTDLKWVRSRTHRTHITSHPHSCTNALARI